MTTQTVPALTPEQAAEQARILRVGSGVEAYRFAYKVPGADIPAMQARVLAVGAGVAAYVFARNVVGADIAACQARVLAVGTSEDIYHFARNVPDLSNADIMALQARVLELGVECRDGGFCAYSFAMSILSADVEVLYTHAQAQGFSCLDDQQCAEFDALLAAYRAQRQLLAGQSNVVVDAGAGPVARPPKFR